MTAGRVDQPQVGNALRDHEQRIRQLEAVPAGTGLRYDTDNEGDWFFARANVGEVNRDGDGTTVVSWEFSTGDSGAPFLIDGDGGLIVDTAGGIVLNLPTVPGFAGSLYSNAGVVTVSP